jgi:hypothetical protein
MNLTDLVDHSSVEEDTLGERRLPGIDMRRDPDVSGPLKRIRPVWMVRVQILNSKL